MRHFLSALVLMCHLMPKVNDTNINGRPESEAGQCLLAMSLLLSRLHDILHVIKTAHDQRI